MSNCYVLGPDPTTISSLPGNPVTPSTSYVSPGMGLFSPASPYGAVVTVPEASYPVAGSPGNPPVSSVAVSSLAATTVTVTTSVVGAIVSPSSTVSPASVSMPTVSWSTVAATPVSGSTLHDRLPKHSFVFSPLPGATRTTIDHGVSINVPFRGVTNDEFLDAIARTVPAVQITDISRVAGTVQVYFTDPSWARQLLASGLDMRQTLLEVLPVGVTPKRIILSDVPPHFPDAHVRSILATYGDVRGKIFPLPAATNSAKFNHVRTNRRAANVVFATDQDFLDMPSQIAVRYDNVDYVFQVNNPVKCFHCSTIGHTAQACPKRVGQSATKLPASKSASSKSSYKLPPIVPPTTTSVVTSALPTISAAVPPTVTTVVSPVTSPPVTSPPVGSPFVATSVVVSTVPSVATPVVPLTIEPPALSLGSPIAVGSSADDDSTNPAFTVVTRRKRKPLYSSPAANVMGPPPPMAQPITKSRKHPKPKYSFDYLTNNWADGKGSFTPLFDLPTVAKFAQATVALDTVSASAHLSALATDRSAVTRLLRQVQVWVYTDPSIAALDAKPRSNERLRFHRLVARLRK